MMEAKKLRNTKDTPEKRIRDAIRAALTLRSWHVEIIHGNMYQSGLPDLYAMHRLYGTRWIEVKDPKRTGDVMTSAQRQKFQIFTLHGCGIWILTSAAESELKKLSQPPNWANYIQIMKN